MHVVTDIAENLDDCSVLRSLFFQVQPQTLIVKIKQDDGLMAVLNELAGIESARPRTLETSMEDMESHENGGSDDEIDRETRERIGNSCKLRLLPSNYFNLEAGKNEKNNVH